jgi:hypothetical protein
MEVDFDLHDGYNTLPDGTVLAHRLEHDLSDGCTAGRSLYLQCEKCGRLHRVEIGCGKRFDYFCPICAKRWRKKVFARYWRCICAMRRPKFLTLTLKKDGGKLTERLKGLWEMKKSLFRRLREKGYAIDRWCGIIEPPNHVHIVIDSDYIPQKEISLIWKTITGDSYIVDLRKLSSSDPRGMAAYITKYLTKASAWTGINLDLLKGFHLIASYNLPKRPPPRPMCLCGVRALHPICEEHYRMEDWYWAEDSPLDEYVKRFAINIGKGFIVVH